MIEKKVTVQNIGGINARAAAAFVQATSQYKSSIWIEKENVRVNAKSIMGVISLALAKGEEVVLKVGGEDETAAVNELEKLITSNFSA